MSNPALGSRLVGRDSELSRLVGWISDAAAGRGRAVLVEGEPGIGKSTLVRAGCATALPLGAHVFWGAGDELGQALPLLPLLEGLRVREQGGGPRRTTILQLLRGEFAVGAGEDVSAAVAEQLLALVHELCAQSPTILVVDDLQWADQATVTVWGRLARSARQLPLLLVGMTRPVPRRDDLMALRRIISARLRLSGLPEPAAAELVAALAGGKPDEELLRLADGAAGNPLYLTELVEALARGPNLTITDAGIAQLTKGHTPSSLSAAIADRLGFVPGVVREVLRAAALLGVDFSVRDLAVVLGSRVADLFPAVDEARTAGVLTEAGENLAFRHPLIRAALYDEISAPVRAAWHRDVGRALAEAGAPVDRVARQLLHAVNGSPGTERMDEWMLRWLVEAAPLLVGQAHRAAVQLLRHAVASCGIDSAQRDLLVCRFADALYRVGDTAEAERVATRALADVADPDLLVDLHWTLTQCRAMAGRSAESFAALDEALAAPRLTARHRARLLVLTARTHRSLGQVETAGKVAAAALAEAGETGDRWAIGWALHVLTLVAIMRGRVADALPLFDRALDACASDPALTDLRLLLQINQAIALGDLDQNERALAAAQQVRRLADHTGSLVRLAQAQSALGQLLFDTGRWDDALAEVDVVPEDLKDPGVACCDHGVAAVISFHRGELVTARRHLAAAAPHAQRIGNRVVGPLALACSLDLELTGDPAEALAALTAGFTSKTEELEEVEELFADAVRLAVGIDDVAAASTVTGSAEALTNGAEIPHRRATALYCRGLLDHNATRLLQAAERFREAGRPLQRAKALEASAVAFVDGDDRSSARAAFTRAVDLYASLGAARDVARLQARFRAHGIRRGPRVKHRHARRGWESLTPTETRIAALVVEGMSNPQIAAQLFLSPRTVATHVSHILSKLDVHSRIDIAREASRRDRASA